MTSIEDVVVDSARLPRFDLEYGVDDTDRPTSVTVYAPDADDISTHWITIDADHAVPLEDVR